MSKKKYLLPLLAALPLLFMANSPAPQPPIDSYYQNIETEFVDTTEAGEDAPLKYEVSIKNVGEEKATPFNNRYNKGFYLGSNSYKGDDGRYYDCYPFDIHSERFETSLFFNELILPGETKTFTIYPKNKLDPLPEKDDFHSQYVASDTFIETCETLTVSVVTEVENQYEIKGLDEQYSNSYVTIVLEVTYDENSYAFFVERNNENKYVIDTFSELDLTKLTITKASIHKPRSRGSGGFAFAFLFFYLILYAGYYLGYGILICFAIGVFIVAPAIVIPISIKRGKRRAEEREEAMKKPKENDEKTPEKNEEDPEETVEVTPEELTDINKIE